MELCEATGTLQLATTAASQYTLNVLRLRDLCGREVSWGGEGYSHADKLEQPRLRSIVCVAHFVSNFILQPESRLTFGWRTGCSADLSALSMVHGQLESPLSTLV